ncbi:MAG: peptide chain release factor N(5)-glutamine methyltransferase [Synechococcaceae cyanobacterium]|nr:peptide chain release factor N(5)-glutamine methyltransferase [Synechococcaceae cyanobacterium]
MAADDLLAWRRRMLLSGGGSADLDWLLEMAGGLSWSALQRLWLRPHRQVVLQRSRMELEAIWRAHLQGNAPLQYLVGCCPWRDMTLAVGPAVLIPRQETELMVELLLQACRPDRLEGNPLERAEDGLPPRPVPALWADLGTGSGCLAIALARAFPGSTGLAVDLSDAALAQAGRNLESLGLNRQVRLLLGSWWAPLQPWWGQLELVVANPPYIPTNVLADLDPVVRDHEPWLALDGGADGLACLRSVIDVAPRALAPGGLLLVEHHHDQSRAVLDLMEAAGLLHPQAHRDLEGVPRFVSASRPLDASGAPSGTPARGRAQAPAGIDSPEALPTPGQGRLNPSP